jgi:hypothetical protein
MLKMKFLMISYPKNKDNDKKQEQIDENNKFNNEFNQYLTSKEYNKDDWEFLTISIKKDMPKIQMHILISIQEVYC